MRSTLLLDLPAVLCSVAVLAGAGASCLMDFGAFDFSPLPTGGATASGGDGGSTPFGGAGGTTTTTTSSGGAGGAQGGFGGSGGAGSCVIPANCGPAASCWQYACDNYLCVLGISPIGTACTDNGGHMCDGQGNCTDCGGPHPPPGGSCSAPCTPGCASNQCVVDCSNTSCAGLTVDCPVGLDCEVDCPPGSDCTSLVLNCPDTYACRLVCGAPDVCLGAQVNGASGSTALVCQGSRSCHGTTIACGSDLCAVTCDSNNQPGFKILPDAACYSTLSALCPVQH